MSKLAFGTNFAVFVIFFGVSLLDAFASRDFLRALLWMAVALLFLRADAIARRKQAGGSNA